MKEVSGKKISASGRRVWLALATIAAAAVIMWVWRAATPASKPKGPGAVPVISAVVTPTDVSVRLTANGMVAALQTVDIRPQLSATIRAVHIKEGQFVRKGDRLFSLDVRTEDANLSKNTAQVFKDRADLANAERNLERQRELFKKEYISRMEFEAAENQVALLRGQLEVDSGALEATRVARSFGEITAPIDGRTGAITVYPGSLVQPNNAALVSIAQIDPINVSFTVPERELAALHQSFAAAEVPVYANPDQAGQAPLKGQLVFIDNAVDTTSGTIRLKAQFANPDHRLWPGMFVTVTLAPRKLAGALTVPVHAVQTGPEQKFVYVIEKDNTVTSRPVTVRLIQDNIAVIEGVAAGTRVVAEGAQNLRAGSAVVEGAPNRPAGNPSGPNAGKGAAPAGSASK